MTVSKSKNLLFIAVFLLLAYIIEAFLSAVFGRFAFAYLVGTFIGYVSIFLSILLLLRDNINGNNFLKPLGFIVIFSIVDKTLPFFLPWSWTLSILECLRPAIALAFIFLAVNSVSKIKKVLAKGILSISVVSYALYIALCIANNIYMANMFENVSGSVVSYFNAIQVSNYLNVAITFFYYLLCFMSLAYVQVSNDSINN